VPQMSSSCETEVQSLLTSEDEKPLLTMSFWHELHATC